MHMILLRPTVAWRLPLLDEGPCGARPPLVVEYEDGWSEDTGGNRMIWILKQSAALPLLWKGKVVPQGMDAAARILLQREGLACERAAWEVGVLGWMTIENAEGDGVLYHGRESTIAAGGIGYDQYHWIPALQDCPAGLTSPQRRAWMLVQTCCGRDIGTAVMQ